MAGVARVGTTCSPNTKSRTLGVRASRSGGNFGRDLGIFSFFAVMVADGYVTLSDTLQPGRGRRGGRRGTAPSPT